MSLNLSAIIGAPGLFTVFTAQADDAVSYTIDYGDGTSSVGSWQPGLKPLSIPHAYSKPGTYNVVLICNVMPGLTLTANYQAVIPGTPPPPLPPPTSGVLLHKGNLTYAGAFRVPADQSGGQWLSGGGAALAMGPAGNSLLMVGMSQYVCELSIPTLTLGTDLTKLAVAKFIQPLTNMLGRLPSNPSNAGLIGGLLDYGSGIVGTAYVYYDGSGSAVGSHWQTATKNLSSAIDGIKVIAGAPAGHIAGYMCQIPVDWQDRLGAKVLTGQCNIPIISRTSSGPAAFGLGTPLPGSTVKPFLDYPLDKPLGIGLGGVDPLQNLATQVPGVVWVPGTDTVLFFGTTATSLVGYGADSSAWGDPNAPKGSHSLNGEYALQCWAYGANDFLAVKQGRKQPWDVEPYDVWNFSLPFNSGRLILGGAAYDPGTKHIYLTVVGADNVRPYSFLPVVCALQVDPEALEHLPRIGALTGYPMIAKGFPSQDYPQYYGTYAGAVKKGDPVLMTAGNVYDPAEKGIASVIMQVNGSGIIVATQSTIPHASHNWQTVVATMGLASGSHTVVATVKTVDGRTNTQSWRLYIQ